MKKAYLVLKNGMVFEGYRFGAETDTVGELVFTTGMCGYIETLTDPSYYGQIVMQTFPLNGNYGIIDEDLLGKCYLKGYVVRENCETPSNFRCDRTVDAFLKEQGVPGICGVDTRELTRIIREAGVMSAAICSELPADNAALEQYEIVNAVENVCTDEKTIYPAQDEEKYHVAMINYGAKSTYAAELQKRGCTVTELPYHATADEVAAVKPDGIFLTGGPGDPSENAECIAQLKVLLGTAPIMGIGLGHQLLALAHGGCTEKLKYGHRGANQPVREVTGTRTFITTQNHGYVVDGASVTGGVVRFENANDGTCEGLEYSSERSFSIQFEPDTSAGPNNTAFLYDEFITLMGGTEHAAE